MAEEEQLEREDQRRGLRTVLAEALVGDRAEVVDTERMELIEAEVREGRYLKRDLDLLAYSALDYFGGNEQDMKAIERRKLVQRSRIAWQQDPQVGVSTELMNDFALGRGVPRPQARDPEVQKILDEAWGDEDNELVMTSYASQLSLNTDLTLQCNLFVLVFAEEDGKVKLGMLDHDTVENVVRDPDNRRRILYYVARSKRIKWDYGEDGYVPDTEAGRGGKAKPRLLYYKNWAVEVPEGEKAPDEKLGEGEVYHVAINKTGEMAFGHPSMHRMLRWATAFNSFMEARVDIARAVAAFIMKRKVKGTPNQVRKLAEQALTKRAQLGTATADLDAQRAGELEGPRAGSVLTENEEVDHESFSLDSGASNANLDAQMLRSQISSGSPGHWPQHYLGDVGSSNLATASAMELAPMKSVESRQEIIEQLFRWFCDLSIEKAIDKGRLKKELTPEELAEKRKREASDGNPAPKPTTEEGPDAVNGNGNGNAPATMREAAEQDLEDPTALDTSAPGEVEDEGDQDDDKLRDLSYDFSLPSPVRRMVTDLVNAVESIARTFDPNNTNKELSRTLLGIVLGEGLEMSDPGEVVEKIFPPGYEDPAMKALSQLPPPGAPGAPGGPGGPGGTPEEPEHPTDNPYGARIMPTTGNGGNPYGSLGEALDDLLQSHGRDGRTLEESLIERLSPDARKRLEAHLEAGDRAFEAASQPVKDLAKPEGGESA